jgi:hypothetical protein
VVEFEDRKVKVALEDLLAQHLEEVVVVVSTVVVASPALLSVPSFVGIRS